MKRLCLPAPAKLNLFLHILRQREDGYHDLQTLFQFVDLADTLALELLDSPTIDVEMETVPAADNLVMRAARALQAATGCRRGARIRVDKRIPMGGGLGGGSSDAATTLVGLNRLWNTGLDRTALQAIGVSLGADVPIFIHGESALAEGVGERFSPAAPPESWYLLAIPPCHVPTARLFQEKQLTRNSLPITLQDFLEGRRRNDFEPVTRRLFPEVDHAMRVLDEQSRAYLTGTGACVFSVHDSQEAAESAARAASRRFAVDGVDTRALVARGLNRSPLYASLAGWPG